MITLIEKFVAIIKVITRYYNLYCRIFTILEHKKIATGIIIDIILACNILSDSYLNI